jgi:hypothetical protein
MDYQTLVLSVAGIVGPIILACGAFFSRKRIYAKWAKTPYIIASLAGFVWGILGFIVWRPVHVSPQTWIFLLHIRDWCGGILTGFVPSPLLAALLSFAILPALNAQQRADRPRKLTIKSFTEGLSSAVDAKGVRHRGMDYVGLSPWMRSKRSDPNIPTN